MPAIRIYDQTVGQTAGIPITTTGMGAITRDGLEAYAQIVVSASGSGVIGTATGSGNVVTLTGATITAGTVSFTANAQSVIIDTLGFENAAFTVSGFGTATLAVQWSNLSSSGFTAGTVATVGSSTTGTTITANGQYTAASGGRYLKILTTAFTTGPILVTPTFYAGGGSGGGGSSSGVTQIQDGTASGNAAVKAASTAPVATDPALVVAISPNGQNANGQATMANSTPVVLASDQTTISVSGNVANDGVDSGNPVKIGGYAATAFPTAVAAADRVNGLYSTLGEQVTISTLRLAKGYKYTSISSSTAKTTIATAVASTFLDLYSLVISNSSATDTDVLIEDDTTSVMTISVKAGATAGFTVESSSAIPQIAVNKNWSATCADSVAAINVTALYVKRTA